LAELLPDGKAVVGKLCEWLGLRAGDDDRSPELRVVALGEFLGLQIPPREKMLPPWLPTQGLVLLYAARGLGKTFFALWFAYAVATASQFLRWRGTKPWRVLFIDGEMPAVVLQERLASIVKATAAEPPSPEYFQLITPDLQAGAMIDLANSQSQAALQPYVEQADLVIADNISTLCGGNENEADDWRPVAGWALMLRRMGKSLALVHHAGKNGEQRGISKREDILDTVIELKQPRDYQPDQGARFEVHFKKHRGFFGDDAKPFEAHLVTDDRGGACWTVKNLDDCVTERIVTLTDEGWSQREIAKELAIGVATVNRHTQKARAKGILR
jgi:putative DNA primase/helicase